MPDPTPQIQIVETVPEKRDAIDTYRLAAKRRRKRLIRQAAEDATDAANLYHEAYSRVFAYRIAQAFEANPPHIPPYGVAYFVPAGDADIERAIREKYGDRFVKISVR